jgi:hypothetical protein
MAIAILAIVLGACGSRVRTTNYHDYGTGVSVSVECKYDKWGGAIIHDSCKVIVLDDGL